jgi:2-keto-4-pentenoate hydratase/2-oxohepta-3-ene-1,7-dioic acid hydratase in catechol pathway
VKIGRCRYNGTECYGVLNHQTMLCLPALARHFKKEMPSKLEDFVAQGENALKTAEDLVAKASYSEAKGISVPLSEVMLLAPLAFPPKIICLGLNYVDHAAESKATFPDEPIFFMKPHTTIVGPNQYIIKPSFVTRLDYEGELAVVIGKTAKNIPTFQAKKHIFGYTILNDVSACDIQFKDGQWTRGKSLDAFAPTEPCITTENQLKSTDNLAIRTWVNGEIRQNGNTRNMVFNVSQVVHHVSRVMTLKPCDIIATGTPAGVGFAVKPPQFLKHCDVVRIEIEGIGALENAVEERG